MSVPSWTAAGLPRKVLAQGYERVYQDAVKSTSMEAGNFKTRLKSQMASEAVQASILTNEEGIARFRRFFRETTRIGTLPFMIPDQVFDGASLADPFGDLLFTPGGEPIEISAYWLVLFTPGSPPREGNNRGAWFDLRFSLTILP